MVWISCCSKKCPSCLPHLIHHLTRNPLWNPSKYHLTNRVAFPPHLLLALPVGDARRIPEILREGTAGACNGLLGRRQGAQGRVGVEGPVAPGFTWSRAQQGPKNPLKPLKIWGFIPPLYHHWIILPVRPFWKNIPMMAIMASRPLAISAANFFSLVAAGAFTKPLGMPRKPAFSKSPGALLGSST